MELGLILQSLMDLSTEHARMYSLSDEKASVLMGLENALIDCYSPDLFKSQILIIESPPPVATKFPI